MASIYSIFLLLSFSFFTASTDKIEKITIEQLQAKTIRLENDTLYIVNFWATWCGPCIAELPYFEQAAKTHANKKIKILLINLDFISEEAKVLAFVKKKNLQNAVYQLNAADPNKWINQIDADWDGAIPVTVFYKAGKKILFHEGDITQTELDEKIKLHSI
ncbi:TlpA disulfide reductase family protein [Cytophaga aurantiaca]|uniref:TlpA disulfide reductase family protein n=1 Tax=Cytophaga aurantiaca TaxID=29530 RepID=UPI000381E908|nr:TlpA disulfide reductase family protein [Cytophaga aurantiaca]